MNNSYKMIVIFGHIDIDYIIERTNNFVIIRHRETIAIVNVKTLNCVNFVNTHTECGLNLLSSITNLSPF